MDPVLFLRLPVRSQRMAVGRIEGISSLRTSLRSGLRITGRSVCSSKAYVKPHWCGAGDYFLDVGSHLHNIIGAAVRLNWLT